MTKDNIEKIVITILEDFCKEYQINTEIDKNTHLIGGEKILDSMGLVMFIVDIETAFLEEDIEISLTSESAMSGRISPFRTVGSMCNFIAKQLKTEIDE
jgi:acyl carrier protein